MIQKYQDFLINESKKVYGITPEEIKKLNFFGIETFEYNPETKLIDVIGDVNIIKKLTELPDLRLGTIDGYFDCQNNELTTLKNSPKKVTQSFHCTSNDIESLEYSPIAENSNFDCSDNKLTTLKGCQQIINGYFSCTNNELDTLEYCPKKVVNFYCEENFIDSIEDYPLCMITNDIYPKDELADIYREVLNITKEHKEIFEKLLDDKIKFHQMIMLLEPDLIQYYTTIPIPSKKHRLLS